MSKNSQGASGKPDRAFVPSASSPQAVSPLRASIPSAFAEQACTISKTGSTVTVECDDPDEANEVFEWLSEIPDEAEKKGDLSWSMTAAQIGSPAVDAGARALMEHQFGKGAYAGNSTMLDNYRGLARVVLNAVAQAIETRRAETERLGAKHESAVGEADAPKGDRS